MLDFLVWSQQQTPPAPLEPSLTSVALRNHQADVLRWLKQNGLPWEDDCAYVEAIEWDRALEFLPLIHAEAVPWSGMECDTAAKNGRLEVLQWLRMHGCPWSDNTCRNAAEYGRLDILQWLRQNGCPWEINSMVYFAIQDGHWPVLQWVLTQEQPRNMQQLHEDYWVCECGHLEHPPQYYQALAWLNTQHVFHWSDLKLWLDAVTDVSRDVLNITLCSDLTRLVQTYC